MNNLTKDETDTAHLSVTATGINEIDFVYEWKKKNNDVPLKVSRKNQKVLSIPNLLESDEGIYFCTVINRWNQSAVSSGIHLVVQGTCKT